MATPKSVAFYTLGCKLNYSETSAIGRQFDNHGFSTVKFEEGADVYVINTCSVTDFADRKCRKTVRQALKANPNGLVVVIGCYAQLKPQEISEIPGVDLVLGAAEKFNILNYIEGLTKSSDKGMVKAGEITTVNSFVDAFSFGDRTRSFLKVQDGCNYNCSFCTIPLARGTSRSDTVENVVANAKKIAEMGVKEIVLTGVNLGDFGYGRDIPEGEKIRKETNFLDLIKALDQIQEISRFRISSIEPNLLTNEIIEFVAQSRAFVPHFHIPLQSGSPEILKSMRRRYKRDLYADRISKIKEVMPHCCIGVDVIVGFPGETEERFMETFDFIHGLDISYLHVFTYSERPNTLAAELPGKVDMHERRKRNAMLTSLSEKKKREFYAQHVGTSRKALIEQSREAGILTGFTDNYIKLRLPAEAEIQINEIMEVELGNFHEDGTLVSSRIETPV